MGTMKKILTISVLVGLLGAATTIADVSDNEILARRGGVEITHLEFDARMIRRSGLVGAQRFTEEAALERRIGKSALLRGSAARRAARYGMAATALGGASDIASLASRRGGKTSKPGTLAQWEAARF